MAVRELTPHRVDGIDVLCLLIEAHGLRKVEEWLRNLATLEGRVPRERVKPLIETAPELLQACKDTMSYWDDTEFSKCAEGCDCIVDSMRAAIAKAEGR